VKSHKKEVLSTLFWLIFSIIFCIGAVRSSLGNIHQPGPGLFPFLCGLSLVFLSSINLIAVLKKMRRRKSEEPESTEEPVMWRNIIITLVVLFSFPVLLDLIGLAPTLFVFFLVMLRFIEPQGWLVIFGGSAAGAAIFALVFQVWLNIRFPKGIFGI
jgi:putative tricarboxylic transport membrane protein